MPAANTIPTDALVKVLTALVKHARFDAIYQVSIAWKDFPNGQYGREIALVDNQYSSVTPDPVYCHDEGDSDYEEITEHLRTVESKLARLHWT